MRIPSEYPVFRTRAPNLRFLPKRTLGRVSEKALEVVIADSKRLGTLVDHNAERARSEKPTKLF